MLLTLALAQAGKLWLPGSVMWCLALQDISRLFWLRTSLNACFPALGFGLKGFTGFAVPCFRVFKTLTNALDFKDF